MSSLFEYNRSNTHLWVWTTLSLPADWFGNIILLYYGAGELCVTMELCNLINGVVVELSDTILSNYIILFTH